jgi:RecB family exonuclease
MGAVTNWSASSLAQFEKCPHAIYLARVLRAPRPEQPADGPLARGTQVHELAERYVRGELEDLPRTLGRFGEQFMALREACFAGHVKLEEEWGFTRTWEPTEYLGKDCWALIKCDVVQELDDSSIEIIDYKTGKSWGKEVPHGQQMQIYAAAGVAQYPAAKLIKTTLWYLDEGKARSKVYTPDQVLALRARLDARADRLTGAIAFPHKPNRSNCRYCDFGPNNGGTNACPYGVETDR